MQSSAIRTKPTGKRRCRSPRRWAGKEGGGTTLYKRWGCPKSTSFATHTATCRGEAVPQAPPVGSESCFALLFRQPHLFFVGMLWQAEDPAPGAGLPAFVHSRPQFVDGTGAPGVSAALELPLVPPKSSAILLTVLSMSPDALCPPSPTLPLPLSPSPHTRSSSFYSFLFFSPKNPLHAPGILLNLRSSACICG